MALIKSTVNFTRPANTTAYAASDVVGPAVAAVLEFTNMARLALAANSGRLGGNSGYITQAALQTNKSTITAKHMLHLFNTAPAVIADNAANTRLWADTPGYIGFIEFPAMATGGSGSDKATAQKGMGNANMPIAYTCADEKKNLYGVLVTSEAYTPDSGQQYSVALWSELDE